MSVETPLPPPSPKRRGRPPGSRNRVPAMQTVVPPVTMRVAPAADYVGVSVSLMKKWIGEKRVKSVAIGRVRLVYVASLNELVGAA